jgi:hypothetical protein
MSRSFDDALAIARQRRRALTNTLGDMRQRFTPPQLAEDVLGLIDPELELLHRARERIQNNRLLSLAVLAGVGWLVGAPRQNDGEPLGADDAGSSPPRANMKEKKNDSGQIHGEHWSGPGAGRQEDGREEVGRPQKRRAEEAVLARRNRQAQQGGGGGAPVHGKPRHPVNGQQDAEQQPHEHQPEIGRRF